MARPRSRGSQETAGGAWRDFAAVVAASHAGMPVCGARARRAATGAQRDQKLRCTYRIVVATRCPVMRRFTLAGIVLIATVAGCAAHDAAPARAPQFPSEEQKLLACLDLQDHIIDLYATEYVEHEGITLTSTEKVAFRDGWAEELAKRGTFDRFEQSCFSGLTPNKYECGMQSSTTGGLVACMKLSMR